MGHSFHLDVLAGERSVQEGQSLLNELLHGEHHGCEGARTDIINDLVDDSI